MKASLRDPKAKVGHIDLSAVYTCPKLDLSRESGAIDSTCRSPKRRTFWKGLIIGFEAMRGDAYAGMVPTSVVEATFVFSNPDIFLISESLALPISASFNVDI